MASSNKKVTLEVAVKTQEAQIDALERKVERLRQQKLQMKIDADTQALDAVSQKLKNAESKLSGLKAKVDVDDSEIETAEREVEQLKQEQINLQLRVEEAALDELQSKKDAIEADEINVQLNNQSAMQGLEQIADGFSRIKSAASEVGQEFGSLLSSAGKQETNFAFLKNAVGDAELARQKMSEINDIVAQLPGDDTALQGLLSSAAAKDSSLTADNLRDMANSATDYFSAMSYYGKSATEAQQDMTNYLLAGNTAELERSPILQGHIDKLKEATTVQERAKALAEALNEEHWGGMGAMDTYNNKLETFNGMIERGRYTLGGMFQEGAKEAMDFLLKLDEGTNGLVGMTIALGGFASPLTDALMGLGQMATGFKALKDAANFSGIKDKLSTLKTALVNVGSAAKTAAVEFATTLKSALISMADAAKKAALAAVDLGKKTLIAGANAVKAAGMWLIEKAQVAASAIAKAAAAIPTYALAIAEWFLASPILIVVAAVVALIAVLWYLYNTNDSVRASIDNLIVGLQGLWDWITSFPSGLDVMTGAFEYLQGAWQNTVDFFQNGINNIINFFNPLIVTVHSIIQVFSLFASGQLTVEQAVWGVINAFRLLLEPIAQFILDVTGLGEVWQFVMDLFTQGSTTLTDMVGSAFTLLTDSFNFVVTTFQTYAPLVAQALFVMATGGIGAIVLLMAHMNGMPNQLGAILQSALSHVVSWVSNLVSRFTSGASQAVNNFLSQIRQMPGAFAAELNKMIQQAIDFANRLPQIIGDAARNALAQWFGITGEGSPGYIYYAFEEELDAMQKIAGDNDIASNIGRTATDMVNSWGDPNLNYNIASAGSAGNGTIVQLLTELITAVKSNNAHGDMIFNMNGDMDNEERMKRFLEYVKEYLDWDNKTAGRTV